MGVKPQGYGFDNTLEKVRNQMNFFLFYECDVCIGSGYGLDPEDAIARFCQKMNWTASQGAGITPVFCPKRSEWDVNIFNCPSLR